MLIRFKIPFLLDGLMNQFKFGERILFILNLKHLSFSAQDDVVMGTLTVRENFEFSATLRLPRSVKNSERKERVNQTIYELGLTEVADSKVGH